MTSLKKLFDPKTCVQFSRKVLLEPWCRLHPNARGAVKYPPGHYYSPLLDIESVKAGEDAFEGDGPEYWEYIDLREAEQRRYYEGLIAHYPSLPFPAEPSPAFRYYTQNAYFGWADAFALWGVMLTERPRRIIEVGSGFSSAAMVDTLRLNDQSASLTFIEPYPAERLHPLLADAGMVDSQVLAHPVQETSLTLFDELEAHDILFIDSSHVAKIGSDVNFLFLRVLSRLKPGVIVHIHDIFYPISYPMDLLRKGHAWNETLFLRTFLTGNPGFEMLLFNSFAQHTFPELFHKRLPAFMDQPGSSLWLRKVA